jgi:hypothetical protein
MNDLDEKRRVLRNGKVSSTAQRSPSRRATLGSPAPDNACHVNSVRPETPQSQMGSIQGILKTHNKDDDDIITPSQHRVSFLRRQDGTINNCVSRYDIDASPNNESPSLAVTARRSLRNSMNWPPPPPPRDSTWPQPPPPRDSPQIAQNRNLSSVFQRDRVVELPFPGGPAQPPRSRPIRRCSMLEMQQMKEIEAQTAHTSTVNLPGRRKSDGIDFDKDHQAKRQMYYGARSDYFLGDLARSLSHMMIETCPQAALKTASQLQNYDFAFIKRSDESWTYAILAYRHLSNSDSNEEYMIFVMDEEGSTKTIKKKQWASFVRCVVGEDYQSLEEFVHYSIPQYISIDCNNDDCSIISFNSRF